MTTSERMKGTITMLSLAQVGYAEWLFGNLYEAIVRVPDLLAGGRIASILGSGSPVLYYLPGGVVAFGATLVAVIAGWKSARDRGLLVAVAVTVLAGGVATAYVVRTVNLSLFIHGNSIAEPERSKMLSLWYRVNLFRLGTTAAAWLLAARINSRLHSQSQRMAAFD